MRRVARLVLLLLLIAPAGAAPFADPQGEWREYFRDWLAACPDAIDEDASHYYGYSCFASTGSAAQNSDQLPSYKLTLIRNRLDGELDIAITVAADEARFDESRPMQLVFTGDPPVILDMGEELETRFDVSNQYFVADETVEAWLIERMQDGATLKLMVPLIGREAPVEIKLSLQGVMSSLDFMATHARKVAQY